MLTRIISGLIMIAVVLSILFQLPYLFFTSSLSILVGLASWEWIRFLWNQNNIFAVLGSLIIGLFSFGAGYYLNYQKLHSSTSLNLIDYSILVGGAIFWLVVSYLVLVYPKHQKLYQNALIKLIFALATLAPFFVSVLALRSYNYEISQIQGSWLLLYVLIIVWGADSGAYFVGRSFGKHKLAPKVSPNKTWEGLIGGFITSILIALLFVTITPKQIMPTEMTLAYFIGLSVLTFIASVMGDLFESLLKREASIKDSSNLLPGHGGILDRIDSLTAAVPVFTLGFIL